MNIISQSQIHDYEQCPRRYYLHSVSKLNWPAAISRQTASLDRSARKGQDFHHFVHQLIQGIPGEILLRQNQSADVLPWIENFLSHNPLPIKARLHSEIELACNFAETTFIGKFDVLAIDGDKIIIFDWKTTSHPAVAANYLNTPQTHLYRFLARRCSGHICQTGTEIPAENIQMIYWFPNRPATQVYLPYDEAAYEADESYLRQKAQELSSVTEADYPQCLRIDICTTCPYFSFCHRGVEIADSYEEDEEEQEMLPFFEDDTDREEKIF